MPGTRVINPGCVFPNSISMDIPIDFYSKVLTIRAVTFIFTFQQAF